MFLYLFYVLTTCAIKPRMLQVSKSFLGKKTKQQTLVAGTLRTITVECTNISKKKKKRKKKKKPHSNIKVVVVRGGRRCVCDCVCADLGTEQPLCPSLALTHRGVNGRASASCCWGGAGAAGDWPSKPVWKKKTKKPPNLRWEHKNVNNRKKKVSRGNGVKY